MVRSPTSFLYCLLAELASPPEEDEIPEMEPDIELSEVEMLPMAEETESETEVRKVQLENSERKRRTLA